MAIGLGVVLAVSALGCSSSQDSGPSGATDAGDAGATSDATVGCGSPTPGVTAICSAYAPKSIAAMRQTPASGCFELSHVGLVARTDSPSEPRLYVQDPNGADYSAILAKCSATAQHRCAPAVAAKIPHLLDTLASGAQMTLRGYYQYGKVTTFEEFYIEDILDECAAVPRPAPITLSVADLARDARVPAKWFRRATVDVSAQDPLVLYDLSPADLQLPQPQCPNWEGFAMIPKSAGLLEGAACGGTTNPAGRATDPREILFGRQFFNQFLYTSDCGCAAASKQRLLTPTNTVSGGLGGYLILEQDKASTKAYQVFEPSADKAFPVK
jgi:hypothetical protein